MKDIPGYEGLYAATDEGKIWSYPKRRSSRNGKWLKFQLTTNKNGRLRPRQHLQAGLHKDEKVKQWLVHRLIALAFIPNSDNKPHINHKDGNPLNNRVDNLEWTTQTDNMQHAMRTGLLDIHSGRQDETRCENGRKTGARNSIKYLRKFTMEQVRQIKELRRELSVAEIARQMDCCERTIRNIINGVSYVIEGA